MNQKIWGQVLEAFRLLSSTMLLIIFVVIISGQNLTIKQVVHSGSISVCSCGCEDSGESCSGDCCSTMSLSQCGCTEPHKAVVVFIIPGHLDSFLQQNNLAQIAHIQVEKKYVSKVSFYKSLDIEPPSPIPIG